MNTETKEKILEQGGRIVHRKGFNNTGIAEVVAAAGVPKGSFYFYFPSKKEFGLALVDQYAEMIHSMARVLLDDPAHPPLDRLRAFFLQFREAFAQGGLANGCPIGNLCQEMAGRDEAFRRKLAKVMDNSRKGISHALEQARDRGDLPEGVCPQAAAGFILSAWQGAILQMKVQNSTDPLDVFIDMIFSRFLAKSQ